MIRNRFSENRIRVATPRVDPGNVMDYTGISKGLSASMRAQCRSACACARTARALADKMRAHNPWGLSKTSRDHPSMRAQRALRAQGISRRGLPVAERMQQLRDNRTSQERERVAPYFVIFSYGTRTVLVIIIARVSYAHTRPRGGDIHYSTEKGCTLLHANQDNSQVPTQPPLSHHKQLKMTHIKVFERSLQWSNGALIKKEA